MLRPQPSTHLSDLQHVVTHINSKTTIVNIRISVLLLFDECSVQIPAEKSICSWEVKYMNYSQHQFFYLQIRYPYTFQKIKTGHVQAHTNFKV